MSLGNPARPLRIIDGDGVTRELRATRLTDKDLNEITEWMRAEYIRTARAGLEGMSQVDYDRNVQSAIRAAMAVSVVSEEGRQILATHAGLSRIMWHSFRQNHPELNPETILSFMTRPENVREANEYMASHRNPQQPRPVRGNGGSSPRTRSTGRSPKGTGGRSKQSRK